MEFPLKFLKLRQRIGLTQSEMANRLGISSNYVSLLETGAKEPSPALMRHIELIERMENAGMSDSMDSGGSHQKESERLRMIPVLGWAHAGEFESYEEIPKGWQDWVEADSRDEKAFAVRLQGDSMGDAYTEGDILILHPSQEIYSGCLAVIKLKDDGFIFREIEKRPGFLRLIPWNKSWDQESLPIEQIAWAVPVWRMIRQVLK